MNDRITTPADFTPADYRKISDYLLEEIDRSGGRERELHLDKYTKGGAGSGLAWSYISNLLKYLYNDHTDEAYGEVISSMGFTPEDIAAFERHPFNKCSEPYFFAFQYRFLSFYEGLDFRHLKKLMETYTIRTSAFLLNFERKGSLQYTLVPYHLMAKVAGNVASRYSTISECRSRTLDRFWEKNKRFELTFTYDRTPRRSHPELGRPASLVCRGETFDPSKETCYRSGLSDVYSIICHAPTTYGIALFKGLYLNSGILNYESPLLPDQMPRFYDGRRYRMDGEGYLYDMDDPGKKRMVDSFGKPVHYAEKAVFAFDDGQSVIYGLTEETARTDPRVRETVIYNSERNRFIIYYEMLYPWQKFIVSVARDLKDRISRDMGIDITRQSYRDLKEIVTRRYREQYRAALKKYPPWTAHRATLPCRRCRRCRRVPLHSLACRGGGHRVRRGRRRGGNRERPSGKPDTEGGPRQEGRRQRPPGARAVHHEPARR